MKDRPGRGMDVKPASRASPRLALLFGFVAPEDAAAVAAGAMRVFTVSGVAGPPQMLRQAASSGKSRRNSVTE